MFASLTLDAFVKLLLLSELVPAAHWPRHGSNMDASHNLYTGCFHRTVVPRLPIPPQGHIIQTRTVTPRLLVNSQLAFQLFPTPQELAGMLFQRFAPLTMPEDCPTVRVVVFRKRCPSVLQSQLNSL